MSYAEWAMALVSQLKIAWVSQNQEDRNATEGKRIVLVFSKILPAHHRSREGGFPGELEALQGGWSPGRTGTPGDRRG